MRLHLVLALLLSDVSAAGEGYSMDDLQALEKQGAWAELAAHLGDIPPSKRKEDWQRIAEASAVGTLGSINPEKDGPMRGLETAEQLMQLFPSLKASQAFMSKRAEVGVASFKQCRISRWCSDSDNEWREKLVEFARTDPDRIALKAAEMQMKFLTAAVALPLFQLVIHDKKNPPVCKHPGFQTAVVEALGWNSWYVKDAQTLASNVCWEELKPSILKEFDNPKEKGFYKTACGFLTEKKALSSAQATHCKGKS